MVASLPEYTPSLHSVTLSQVYSDYQFIYLRPHTPREYSDAIPTTSHSQRIFRCQCRYLYVDEILIQLWDLIPKIVMVVKQTIFFPL